MPAQISDVREILYAQLKAWRDVQAPTLHQIIRGRRTDLEAGRTYVQFAFLAAQPANIFAGTHYRSEELGIFQVDIFGPEENGQKHYEELAWDCSVGFWPTGAAISPVYSNADGLNVKLHKAPYVYDMKFPPSVNAKVGRLGSSVDIYWKSNLPRD